VDTGATRLHLRPSVIKALGLEKVDEVISQTTNGPKQRAVYEPVRLDLQGRYGNFDVVDIGENVPNLLGQVPLEVLDLVVDSRGQKLIGNPAHGGEQIRGILQPRAAPVAATNPNPYRLWWRGKVTGDMAFAPDRGATQPLPGLACKWPVSDSPPKPPLCVRICRQDAPGTWNSFRAAVFAPRADRAVGLHRGPLQPDPLAVTACATRQRGSNSF
jgi:predicted aspartyl protease